VPFLPEQLESLDDKTTVLDCASSTLDAAPSTSPLSIFLFFPAFLSFLVFLAQQKVTRLSCIACPKQNDPLCIEGTLNRIYIPSDLLVCHLLLLMLLLLLLLLLLYLLREDNWYRYEKSKEVKKSLKVLLRTIEKNMNSTGKESCSRRLEQEGELRLES